MADIAAIIELSLRRNVDSSASVRPCPARVSPFLASSYDIFEAELIGRSVFIASPKDGNESLQKLIKRTAALGKALGDAVTLYLPSISRRQRRRLIGEGQGFITAGGDYFLPQFALSITGRVAEPEPVIRPFTPSQQAVYLYCLYAPTGPIFQADIQSALGLSPGSVSSALALFTGIGLLDYTVGGKTGRKKGFYIRSKREFFSGGIKRFGTPTRGIITTSLAAAEDDCPKSGMSALADLSDLLPPDRQEFAASPEQAKTILADSDGSEECIVKILKYDPRPFASRGHVDPVTMLLTIDEDRGDERVSIALRQALGGQEWYQG